jgi:S1-C subfamily serine protease
VLAALAFLVVPGVVGYQVGRDDNAVGAGNASSVLPTLPAADGGSGAAGGTGSDADLAAAADAVDDVVVNITTEVEGGGQAAGSGILISANGLVLTNNHVIAGTTGLTVEFATTGVTRSAKVLGYNIVDDVAVIQVNNVSNLKAASLGTSSSLDVGEAIVALGNAGGRGGTPTVVSGTVTGLEEQITASDADGSNVQTLDGLIEMAAAIRSGDSGGPVADADGNVVGMNVAASVSNDFGFPGSSGGGEGYAIPIEDAMAIARKIISGEGGTDIRVGATRAVLGVSIQPTLTNQRVPGGSGGTGSGARVVDVESGSGADDAGLAAGDVIVALGGKPISTTGDLTRALVAYGPGDTVVVTWRDASGETQRAEVELGEGPPA